MKTRWALRFLFFIAGTYLAVGMVLRTEWAGGRLCAQGAALASRFLGQPIVLASCRFDPWRTEIQIAGIRFGGEEGVFSAEKVEVRFSLFAAARGHAVAYLAIDAPRLTLDLAGSGAEPDGAPQVRTGSCLEPLEGLPLDQAVLRDAHLTLHLPEGRTLTLEEVDVDVYAAGRGRRLRLDVGKGALDLGDGAPIAIEGSEAVLAVFPGDERAEVDSFAVRALGSELRVKGSVDNLCAPRLALRAALEARLGPLAAHFLPEVDNVGGEVRLDAALTGPLGDLRAQGQLEASGLTVKDMAPGALHARLGLAGGRLDIEELVWPVDEGRAVVQGAIELGGRMHANLQVRTERMPFHRMLARLPVKNTPVVMAIDSTHTLQGPLRGLALEGRSSLRIHDFFVRNVPWHAEAGTVVVEVPGSASLEGRVRITEDGVSFTSAIASFGQKTQLEIDAFLAFEDARGLDIDVRSPSFALTDVAGHVADIPLGGEGVLEATIRGPYPDPLIEGRFEFSDARLWSADLGKVGAEVTARPSKEELHFSEVEGVRESTRYRGEVDLRLGRNAAIEGELALLPGGRLGEVWGATRTLLAPLDWLANHLDGRIESAQARFAGSLPNLAAEGVVRAREVRLLDRPFDAMEARVRLPDITRLFVEELAFARSGGRTDVWGEVRFPAGETPSVQANLRAEGMPIRDLLGSFGVWADLAGEVGAEATLTGPIDALDLRGSLRGSKLAAHGVRLQDTHLSLETQGDRVIVRGAVVGAGRLGAAVRLAEDLPFDATLLLDVARLENFLPRGSRFDGRLRGQANATGTLADVAASIGNVTLDELVLAIGDYRVQSRTEVHLDFSGPAFVLHGLELEGENTSFSLSGNRSIDDQLDFQAQGSFDARLIGTFLPDLEHPAGVVSVKVSVMGRSARPMVVGSAEIERGSFRHRDLPVSVHSLAARLAFSQNQLVVQDAAMVLNGGAASLQGTVSLKGIAPDVLDLVLTARGMSWRMPAEWPVVASGRVFVTGPWGERVLVAGEATIDRLRWLQDLDIEKMILDFRRTAQTSLPADVKEWVRFDIDLVGGDDMRVDTEHVRARLRFVGGAERERGRLRLVGTNARPVLLGSVEILDGVALFRGSEYRVTNGMVDFRDRERIDPVFDITAETEIRTYRIAAHAYGRLGDYQVDLRSEPALAQPDILTLLTFGVTSQDLDSGGGTAFSGASLAADALLTVSGFDEHVKRWLPRTPLLMDPDISVTSQFSELTGQMEPMAVFEAKVFTDRLKLSAATPFATTKGRRASAELRVSDHLSSQVSWQNEALGYSSGDLGIDLKLRWEWE
ncbi:MAG TPA: translocation/assembly module TamB domain-containing protein [Fredinandcohnia sp.]|nr:translocation/assembly module TamB domain-containing protein [Fredinandcohnia sp.]